MTIDKAQIEQERAEAEAAEDAALAAILDGPDPDTPDTDQTDDAPATEPGTDPDVATPDDDQTDETPEPEDARDVELRELRERLAKLEQAAKPEAKPETKPEPTDPLASVVDEFGSVFAELGEDKASKAKATLRKVIELIQNQSDSRVQQAEAAAQAAIRAGINRAYPQAATADGWAKVEAKAQELVQQVQSGKRQKFGSVAELVEAAAQQAFGTQPRQTKADPKTNGQVRPVNRVLDTAPKKGTKAAEDEADRRAFDAILDGRPRDEARLAYLGQ